MTLLRSLEVGLGCASAPPSATEGAPVLRPGSLPTLSSAGEAALLAGREVDDLPAADDGNDGI